MIPDISLAMDYVRELHPRDLKKLLERTEDLLSETYEYKFGKAVFTIDCNRNRFWIESPVYGHYTYAWGSSGTSFKQFLSGLNKHYVFGKLQIKEEFDKRASFAQLRKALAEVDLSAEKDFEKAFKNALAHIQDICHTSSEFKEMVGELDQGWRSVYCFIDNAEVQSEIESILSEPWSFICTKESANSRKLWKDFEKLQDKLRKEAQCG